MTVSKPGTAWKAAVVTAATFLGLAALSGIAAAQPVSQPELLTSQWSAFRSFNSPDRYIRHRNFLGEVTRVTSELDKLDSTFKVVKGLSGPVPAKPTLSFESKNYPGYYLRQRADNASEEAAGVFHLYIEKRPARALDAENRNSAESRWRRDCAFQRVYRR